MMRGIVLGLLIATGLVLAAPAASARQLEMASMEVDLRVAEDGVLHVEERMDVRFIGSFNGIFRFIPYADLRSGGFRRSLALRIDDVEDGDGRGLEHWVSRKDGSVVVKIRVPGAADAVRRVVVRYRAMNVILGYDAAESPFGGHDELFWNVLGTGWEFPIHELAVRVRLPASLAALEAGSFRARSWRGVYRSEASGPPLTRAPDGSFRLETGGFDAGQAFTVALAFPPGHVEHPGFGLRAWWFLQVNWFLLIPLLLLLLWFLIWWRWGRDALGRRTIIPEYEPPEGLRAADVGVLLDERLDHQDVTAAIIDLAVRGLLTIRVKSGRRRLQLHRDRLEGADLSHFDRELIAGLFGATRDSVGLGSKKYKFVQRLAKLREIAADELVRGGFWHSRPGSIKTLWTVLTVVVLLPAFGLAFVFGAGYGVLTVACGVGMLVIARLMSKRSKRGLDALARIRGMQEYMVTAERERMQALPLDMFERLLPFAIAFGVHDRWLKAFGDLFAEPPAWYASDRGTFGWQRLDRSIRSLDRDVGKNLYSGPRPPARSSGGSKGWGGGWSGGSGFSSGGGFSGGGFGGGGGGGW